MLSDRFQAPGTLQVPALHVAPGFDLGPEPESHLRPGGGMPGPSGAYEYYACFSVVFEVLELPLTDFQVALFDNRVGEDGARQMAASMRGLRQPGSISRHDSVCCPRLSRLVLGLNRNAVSEAGVQDIAQALSSHSLQDLELDLSVSSVGWAGAHDLGMALSSLQAQ